VLSAILNPKWIKGALCAVECECAGGCARCVYFVQLKNVAGCGFLIFVSGGICLIRV
jgi:hypothetical protein